ncbi:hypothetical protein [Priestia megaterium]|uniref:hypothetical protein n=1 Tax=Priestia megaterium TaxID=1404 RepID=UPI00112BE830|nr:hypothetical protein [Priestia megaterium]TPF18069.1 hypothetical protein CBE78_02240 [Priestia megaterium]TPF22176.1 hypothetical protein CBE79_04745 [Priestia megaterium]
MGRKVKCPYCERNVDKDVAIPHQKRYYHEACLRDKERSVQHRKELNEYICKLYKVEVLTGMMRKQIKEFEEEYRYKLKGIELALRYFYDTLDNPLREGDGLGIVPFVYEDAKKHYMGKQKVQKTMKNLNEEMVTEKRVKIKSPQLQTQRKIQKIDMDSLL